jgi:propionyl-CoA carboxylase beta chain
MPKDRRRKLIKAFATFEHKEVKSPDRKHGNIPL